MGRNATFHAYLKGTQPLLAHSLTHFLEHSHYTPPSLNSHKLHRVIETQKKQKGKGKAKREGFSLEVVVEGYLAIFLDGVLQGARGR